MKRSGPPQRKKPLAQGKGLAPGAPPARKQPLASSGPIERKKPIRGVPLGRGGSLDWVDTPSQRQPRSSTGPGAAVRLMVDTRAAGGDVGGPMWCEWPGCLRSGTDRHHRLNRKDGGRHGEMRALLNGAAWLLKACRVHHRQVTSAYGDVLAEAKAMGWVLVEGQHAERVPVLTRWWPELVWLDGEGCWSTHDPNIDTIDDAA